MTRPAMIAAVMLAAYALLDLTLSAFVAMVWKTRAVAPANLPPRSRARRLLLLRLVPTVFSVLITLFLVTPAFDIYEPEGLRETMGPVLIVLAIASLTHFAAAIFRATRSLMLTARIERTWLTSSAPLTVAADMPAFAIDSYSPILALVGVFSPKLIAARTIVDACSPEELARVVGHERGHRASHDNLKRWLMASLPDALRWTPVHDEIVDAWHHAAEDAADDSTTGGDPIARAELAALLLKIVRLAPHPLWEQAIVSPFVERHGLERRVRRLVRPELEPPAPLAIIPMIAVGIMVIGAVAALSSPVALQTIFEAFESLVAFGR